MTRNESLFLAHVNNIISSFLWCRSSWFKFLSSYFNGGARPADRHISAIEHQFSKLVLRSRLSISRSSRAAPRVINHAHFVHAYSRETITYNKLFFQTVVRKYSKVRQTPPSSPPNNRRLHLIDAQTLPYHKERRVWLCLQKHRKIMLRDRLLRFNSMVPHRQIQPKP